MDKMRIIGGNPLFGDIRISGSKNAALPLMAASLLTDKALHLSNVPKLSDVASMSALLRQHGVDISGDENADNSLTLKASSITNSTAPYDIVRKMRASIVVLGPLVARGGEALVSMPGGCVIGTRPIDVHLNGLQQLGAEITLEEGYVRAKAQKRGKFYLKGTRIQMPVVTVTGTENLLMAATLAEGTTQLVNAAREPEIIDLATCLNAMGAHIEGAGTDTITIQGVSSLGGAHHTVIPDRIETGTYVMASVLSGGSLQLTHTSLDLIPTVSSLLEETGIQFEKTAQGFRVLPCSARLQGVDVMTEPFPGFATDLQAQMMTLMTLAEGSSLITEAIFENRFMHVPELCRLGANIIVHGDSALVRGVSSLKGAPVMATDLRASVCLVLAGLAAQGETVVGRIYHLDRGYEQIEDKLRACGANIERIHE